MGFKDIDLKLCYETTRTKTQLLEDFYIPMLGQAKRYFRVAGFFSSSSLTVAAKGIEALIQNEGKMFLLISPELSEQDYEIIKKHGCLTDDISVFKDVNFHDNVNDNLRLLAWMLDNNRLEIKIVVGKNSRHSLFHEKFGVAFDENDDIISFSGSINESAKAWIENIEEFKVFKGWEPGQRTYVLADLKKFEQYWHNEKTEIAEVYDIPTSVINNIVKIKPNDLYDLGIMHRYKKDHDVLEHSINLFEHQKEAVDKWIKSNFRCLFEMATGTGKTRAALGCVDYKLKHSDNEKLLVVISTPQNTLSRQWKKDVEDLNIQFDYNIIVDSSNNKWNIELQRCLQYLSNNIDVRSVVVYTTHTTASSSRFIDIIRKRKGISHILFVCDEVHGAGADKYSEALLEEYEYRIGLSATPERMYDEEGTNIIRTYFGNSSFEFTIRDALRTINPVTGQCFLNHFSYHPVFVSLDELEQKCYDKYTHNIIKLKIAGEKNNIDNSELITRKLLLRANVLKDAAGKIAHFRQVMKSFERDNLRDIIVFASEKQVPKCLEVLSEMGISRAKITEQESASKVVSGILTERQGLIRDFANGVIKVLIGIKCLDEGIDIPSARIGIILASSTNPREYIQRVGRVIRYCKGKGQSEIYDFIVQPADSSSSNSVLNKEARRVFQIAQYADNYEEVRRTFEEKGVRFECK